MNSYVCRTNNRLATASREYNVEWVEKYLDVRGHSGDEYDVLCVQHDDSNASMRVNVAKGVAFCHGCGAALPMMKLARVVGAPYAADRTEPDMAELLRKLDSLRTQGRDKQLQTFVSEDELRKYAFPTRYWTAPLKEGGRGFTEDTVSAFDLGYNVMQDCATIPIRNIDGRLLGFTRRFLGPDADKRYRDPKGFDKSANLFASWFAARDDAPYVVLTEGPLDAIKVWQAGHPALAQFGSNLTATQVKILRGMGFVTVILFYDNDKAGYKVGRSALGFTEKDWYGKKVPVYSPEHDLRRSFVVKQVSYQGVSGKDPGAMEDQDIHRLVTQADLVYKRSRTFR